MHRNDENVFEDDQTVAPAVFGASNDTENANRDIQDTANPIGQVFAIPSEAVAPPHEEATIQLARTEDDELVLVAFSSPERLVACLGDQQPWVAIPKEELTGVQQACEADLLEVDPVIPTD